MIIGSGNIGTDLMIKIRDTSKTLEVGAVVGIDPKWWVVRKIGLLMLRWICSKNRKRKRHNQPDRMVLVH